MTKELLKLAAKAGGIEYHIDTLDGCEKLVSNGVIWNPLFDDGDALRLAVVLRMAFHFEWQRHNGEMVECIEVQHTFDEVKCQCVLQELGTDSNAATRRAIVRAAAEIGKTVAEKSA